MIESRKGFYKFITLFSVACIAYMVTAWKVIGKIVPRKTIAILACLSLTGCASLTYQAPDGTKVTYTRLLTGSDTIKGQAGSAKIEAQGQKAVDPEVLQAVIKIMGAVK